MAVFNPLIDINAFPSMSNFPVFGKCQLSMESELRSTLIVVPRDSPQRTIGSETETLERIT